MMNIDILFKIVPFPYPDWDIDLLGHHYSYKTLNLEKLRCLLNISVVTRDVHWFNRLRLQYTTICSPHVISLVKLSVAYLELVGHRNKYQKSCSATAHLPERIHHWWCWNQSLSHNNVRYKGKPERLGTSRAVCQAAASPFHPGGTQWPPAWLSTWTMQEAWATPWIVFFFLLFPWISHFILLQIIYFTMHCSILEGGWKTIVSV